MSTRNVILQVTMKPNNFRIWLHETLKIGNNFKGNLIPLFTHTWGTKVSPITNVFFFFFFFIFNIKILAKFSPKNRKLIKFTPENSKMLAISFWKNNEISPKKRTLPTTHLWLLREHSWMSSLSQPSTTYLWSHHIHWCTSECKSLSSPIGSLYDATHGLKTSHKNLHGNAESRTIWKLFKKKSHTKQNIN
jgi:hypothetical protein